MGEAESSDTRLRNAEFIRSLATSDDNSKSPINLNISTMNIIELNILEWTGYDIAPRKLKISNTGYTVILSAKWQNGPPSISGGPLAAKYLFAQVHFHWGENEMEGSEHSVDEARMPMELHAVHFKDDYGSLDAALRRPDGVTVAVYFFKLQDEPNPFIDEIVRNMNSIQEAHSSTRIVPRPLTEIMRPFTEDYFLYWGPIVTSHTVHNVLWLIGREPIGVTARQIAEFRKLNDEGHHPVMSNLRPIQPSERRNVFHVCRSGSLYASLLPLPRDSDTSQEGETQ